MRPARPCAGEACPQGRLSSPIPSLARLGRPACPQGRRLRRGILLSGPVCRGRTRQASASVHRGAAPSFSIWRRRRPRYSRGTEAAQQWYIRCCPHSHQPLIPQLSWSRGFGADKMRGFEWLISIPRCAIGCIANSHVLMTDNYSITLPRFSHLPDRT
ncbi:hypothetical protein CENSYa_0541 [Cenarchaeum symbiosum A]|uniref:Uncharacterized protein n=1 Tax=Cenarchaeum symbiosum (strain A) TaxID=414004 RepID=A0RV07_CENSY|nr:hypothetical protein CENSYa_0541 [Cenarchaeum symbiosum A]